MFTEEKFKTEIANVSANFGRLACETVKDIDRLVAFIFGRCPTWIMAEFSNSSAEKFFAAVAERMGLKPEEGPYLMAMTRQSHADISMTAFCQAFLETAEGYYKNTPQPEIIQVETVH